MVQINWYKIILFIFSSPSYHCFPDRFRPCCCLFHSVVITPLIRHARGTHCPLSTFIWQLPCVFSLSVCQLIKGLPTMRLDLDRGMNVRVPFCTLSRTHSIIDTMISVFASPASVVRGPLPIHLDILLRAASLSTSGKNSDFFHTQKGMKYLSKNSLDPVYLFGYEKNPIFAKKIFSYH
jgi:hypothetical protein